MSETGKTSSDAPTDREQRLESVIADYIRACEACPPELSQGGIDVSHPEAFWRIRRTACDH